MEFLYDLDPNKPLIRQFNGQTDLMFDTKNLDKFPGCDLNREAYENKKLIAGSNLDLVKVENLNPNILKPDPLLRKPNGYLTSAFDNLMADLDRR